LGVGTGQFSYSNQLEHAQVQQAYLNALYSNQALQNPSLLAQMQATQNMSQQRNAISMKCENFDPRV